MQEIGFEVWGISRDSIKSHEKFIRKLEGLPFPLLSDESEIVCSAYDVLKEKNMYGKMVKGIERSTFLIDQQGNISAIWRKVKVLGHGEEVLQAAKRMTGIGV